MERAVGWLSWLGRSTFVTDRRSVRPGETLTYTLTLHNDGPEAVTASVSDSLPSEIAIDAQTLLGPGSYDPHERRLSWRGSLESGETVTLAYRAAILTPTVPGRPIVNNARIALEDHDLAFNRSAEVRLDLPDLSSSAFGCMPVRVRPGRALTCTLSLVNFGSAPAVATTARIYPPGAYPLGVDSLWATRGTVGWVGDTIIWQGQLMPGGRATLTFELTLSTRPVPQPLYGVAFLDDGVGMEWERPTWLEIDPWRAYCPLLARAGQ
jgi:uncharacterized repeat protein (TIGR01451 family)